MREHCAFRTAKAFRRRLFLFRPHRLREQERNLSGGIRWQHNAAHDDILLLSPLGQGVMQIERDAGGATLRTADDKTYHATDPEQLAFDVTGWSIPVSGLSAWVRGVPRPGPAAGLVRDDAGRLTRLTQDEWTIEYRNTSQPPASACRAACSSRAPGWSSSW
ncbi:MAG: lipoprotein insertase outer membrane protein LolB [Rhodospirillales bacterium]